MNNYAIIDEYGEVDELIKGLTARKTALRKEILENDLVGCAGKVYKLEGMTSERWTLDTKAIKAEYGELWAKSRSRCSNVTTLKPKKLEV